MVPFSIHQRGMSQLRRRWAAPTAHLLHRLRDSDEEKLLETWAKSAACAVRSWDRASNSSTLDQARVRRHLLQISLLRGPIVRQARRWSCRTRLRAQPDTAAAGTFASTLRRPVVGAFPPAATASCLSLGRIQSGERPRSSHRLAAPAPAALQLRHRGGCLSRPAHTFLRLTCGGLLFEYSRACVSFCAAAGIQQASSRRRWPVGRLAGWPVGRLAG